MQEIDFVIFWVDDTDPKWQAEFMKARRTQYDDASPIRCRNWNNLQYWFRGVEQFAPWVRRVHLVTWGHLPAWLDTSNPKLNIVRHEDFIPTEYLPTFNSITIGINLHRIEGLAEQFVVFNDDMFLCRKCVAEDFFRHGLPCDMARLSVVMPSSIGHIIYNDLELINAKYVKNKVIRTNLGKWFSPRYGLVNLLKSLTLMPWSTFTGMLDHHLPQPFLRRQCFRAWEQWGRQMDQTCRHSLRNITNVSDYLIRYDTLARGEFIPRNMCDSKLVTITDDTTEQICHDIETQRYRMLCINDSVDISDFETTSERLGRAFTDILPKKSSYEL